MQNLENDIRFADHRHPADFIEPLPNENRIAADVIGRVMVWVAQGRTLRDRGYRATVVVFCLRRATLDERTLEDVGLQNGYSRQAVHQLVRDFHRTFCDE